MKMKKFFSLMAMATMLTASMSMNAMASEATDAEAAEYVARATYAEDGRGPSIDGNIEAVWETTEAMYADYCYEAESDQAYGYTKVLWREDTLYLLAVIEDTTLEGIAEDSTTNCANFWVSETGSERTVYGADPGDWHLAVNQAGNTFYYAGLDMSKVAEYTAKVYDGYYVVEAAVPIQAEGLTYEEGHIIGVNISIDDDANGDNERDAFCTWQNHDKAGAYWSDPSTLNKVMLVKEDLPQAEAAYAATAPIIDGAWEEVWDTTEALYPNLWYDPNAGMAYGYTKVLWDENTLYVMAKVDDPTLEGIGDDSTTNCANFWVSETASEKTIYGGLPGDWHLAVNQAGNPYYYTGPKISDVAEYAVQIFEGYYIVEAAVPIQTEGLNYAEGHVIGYNISLDDDTNGDNERDFCCSWQGVDPNRPYWNGAEYLNKIELVSVAANPTVTGEPTAIVPEVSEEPEATPESSEVVEESSEVVEESSEDSQEVADTDVVVEEKATNTGLVVGIVVIAAALIAVLGWFMARKKK